MSAWELADLLGVHEHDISLDHLPNQPLHVVLELARRLDLHPADLTPYAAEVYDHPRYFDAQFPTEPAPGTDTDAVAVLNALAHADTVWDVLGAAAADPRGFRQWNAEDLEGEDVRYASVGQLSLTYWINRPLHRLTVLNIVWLG
ncbi:hypothetical protein ABZ622_40745 [Streptomyces sp. NPDC007164]|uniref:hypothetical protein n=1 Tax=Streptomyces sp. NPDC007164 TaxID=3156918 RepID=UPI00340605FA